MAKIIAPGGGAWGNDLADVARQVNKALDAITARVPTHSVATAPSALGVPRLIYVTDGDSGSPCLAISISGNWKRIPIGSNISVT